VQSHSVVVIREQLLALSAHLLMLICFGGSFYRDYLSRVDGVRELDLKMYRRPFPNT
jgi:hypothetical protein